MKALIFIHFKNTTIVSILKTLKYLNRFSLKAKCVTYFLNYHDNYMHFN